MAKKKQLNEEAAHVSRALKIAIGLHKEAEVVTNAGSLIASTPVGTLFVPCNFDLNCAVLAQDLNNAIKDCDSVMSISEQGNEVLVSWGRRRAALKTKPKVSVYVRPFDGVQQPNVPEHFTATMRDVLKDLVSSINTYSQYVKFTNGAAFWTNGEMAAMIITGMWLPDVIVHIKDLKSALSYQEKDAEKKDIVVTGIGGSPQSMTFHYGDGVAIQIPQVDQSAVKYPEVEKLFRSELYDAMYPLTEDHIDAVSYVSGLSDGHIYIQPTHVGTSRDPNVGTAVQIEGLPLDLIFPAKLTKYGAFNRATAIVRTSNGQRNVSFYTTRDNVTFCFAKMKVQQEPT